MSQPKARPSLWRILQSDYIATLAVLAPVACLITYVVIAVFGFFPGLRGRDPIGADGAPFFFWGLVITAVVGLPFAFWRVKRVRDVFLRGFEVEGHVLEVKFFRDRGSVAYTYTLNHQKIIGWNAIMANKRTNELMPGLPVTLVVDSKDHKRAYIRDVYV